jgi:hypothetical protein
MDRIKNIFDKIGSLIPGYRGYAEREGRRNCDKILRESVVDILILVEKQMNEKMLQFLIDKQKDKMKEIEVLRKKLNTFISKVKYAPHGETAFFTDNQIKEDELFNIYQFDLELADNVIVLTKNSIDDLVFFNNSLENCIISLQNRNNYINEFK